jgi:hypothetical protein
VPGGTVTWTPSIVKVTILSSLFAINDLLYLYLFFGHRDHSAAKPQPNKFPWGSALQKSPLPPFTKGGLGGISEVGFQNLESLNVSNTEFTEIKTLKDRMPER